MHRASIVIPVFNRAHMVRRAIDSSLMQSEPCEVVLVDHGSTDRIRSVVADYKGQIRYVRREEDRGPIACWRDGIEQATGEYVHITYDDDWIQPSFIEETLKLFRPTVGFVYTRARIHQSPNDAGVLSLIHPPGIRPISEFVQYALRNGLTVSPGAAVFRRADALSNLLPDVPGAAGPYGPGTGVGEDLLMFLLTALQYPEYAHSPRPLADFMAHDGSITISAIEDDKRSELSAAYDTAREHYLMQEGAIRPLHGVSGLVSRARWVLASGSPTAKLIQWLNSR